jgi:hypothetical protein
MSKLIFLAVVFGWVCASLTLQAQNKAEALTQDTTLNRPQITFVNKTYDFGKVRKGEKVLTSFYFKNTGTRPLQILQVQTSCGCTATNWSKEPVPPNGVSEITVTFDPDYQENLKGAQEKALLVISNGLNKEEILVLKGEIVKAE